MQRSTLAPYVCLGEVEGVSVLHFDSEANVPTLEEIVFVDIGKPTEEPQDYIDVDLETSILCRGRLAAELVEVCVQNLITTEQ